VLGTIYGAVAEGIRDLLDESPQLEDLFTRIGGQSAIVDAYLASILGMMALIASGYAVQAGLRMRSEETGLRAEPVLATAVGRVQWMGGHLLFSVLGPAVVLLAGGFMAGLVHGLNTGDVGGELPRVVAGALVQLPAVWVLSGITAALFGLAPRLVALAWGALAAFFLLGQVGATLQLTQALLDLSPFTHVPKVPGTDLAAAPLLWLLALAVALVAGGVLGFRRRDVG
jgi:ABC-2 type transport system permease protein